MTSRWKNNISRFGIFLFLVLSTLFASRFPLITQASEYSKSALEFNRWCQDHQDICQKKDADGRHGSVSCPFPGQSIIKVLVHAGSGQTVWELPDEKYSFEINGSTVDVSVISGHDLSWLAVICSQGPSPTPSFHPSPTPRPTHPPSPTPSLHPSPTPRCSPSPTTPTPTSTPTPSGPTATEIPSNTPTPTPTNIQPTPTNTPQPGIGGGDNSLLTSITISRDTSVLGSTNNYNPLVDGIRQSYFGQVLGTNNLAFTAESDYQSAKLPTNNSPDPGHFIYLPKIQLSQPVYLGQEINGKWLVGQKEIITRSVGDGQIYYAHNGLDLFGSLYQLRPGDKIIISKSNSVRTYKIDRLNYISQTESDVLSAVSKDQIVLMTCSFKDPNYRLIFTASLSSK